MSSRNMARRVFFVYFSKPVIIARVLCCLFVDVIWRTTYSMLPVEREDLIRVSLDRITGQFISQARRRKAPLTFLMADADGFKQINTRFGHLTGDYVLAEIAGILKVSIRGSDAVVRYGGDEFLILLSDTTSRGAENVVGRIQENLAEWNAAGHLQNCLISLSTGTAEWQDGKTLDQMLDVADRNMYEQK